ncbi:MAG: NDP-sugar synthase [bacterium]
MKAVIIAGGWGTRLRPLTYNVPKPIVPVVNRPFVIHQIELLKKHGIKDIILNLHYFSDQIREIFGDGSKYGVKIYYSIEKDPLGTAGAVKNAEQYFGKSDEIMVVFNGDVLTDLNLTELIEYHKKNKADITLTLTEVEDPTRYGLVITDENGRVEKFLEKPSWEQVSVKTINAGTYVLTPSVFADVPKEKPYSFERELFPNMLKKGKKVFGFNSKYYWLDIGSPSKYMAAHKAILSEEVKTNILEKKRENQKWIGENVELGKGVIIKSQVLIGNNVKIGRDAKIKEFCVLGERVIVSDESELGNTVIWNNVNIGRNVRIKDAIIGSNCLIEDFVDISGGCVLSDGTIIKKGTIIGGY